MSSPRSKRPIQRKRGLVDFVDARPGLLKHRKKQRRVILPEPGSPRVTAMLPGGVSGSSPLVNVTPNEYVPPHLWSEYQPGKVAGYMRKHTPLAYLAKKALADRARRLGYLADHPMPKRENKVEFGKWLEGLYLMQTKQKQAWVMERYNTSSKMAASVIAKFGGVRGLYDALNRLHLHSGLESDKMYIRHRNIISGWRKPPEPARKKRTNGTDGMIPYPMWRGILRAARYEGILLRFEDFFPELA